MMNYDAGWQEYECGHEMRHDGCFCFVIQFTHNIRWLLVLSCAPSPPHLSTTVLLSSIHQWSLHLFRTSYLTFLVYLDNARQLLTSTTSMPLRDMPGKKSHANNNPTRRMSGSMELPERIVYQTNGCDKVLDLTTYDTWTAEEVTTYVETLGVPIGNAFCQHKISGDILYRLNEVCKWIIWM